MDPASAIGVASAAISFLDFTIGICKLYGQIQSAKDGATKDNAEIDASQKRVREMTETLNQRTSSASSAQLGPNISNAVADSLAASKELIDLLERIRKPQDAGVMDSVKALYKVLRHRDAIKTLQRKAKKARMLVDQGLAQANWETSQLNFEMSTDRFHSLDQQAIEILDALRVGKQALRDVFDKRSQETKQHIDEMFSLINKAVEVNTDRVTSKLDDLWQKVLDMDRWDPEKALKDSMFDPEFELRKENLAGPSPKTFEWIFDLNGGVKQLEDGTMGPAKWDSFSRWLEDSDSSKQYWLSGKAGSGKSTLMANLVRDDLRLRQTKQHLSRWSGSRPLYILSFFLFKATHKQARLEYLLRSLLYQLLKSIPVMTNLLMAEFLPSDCEGRIPAWPLSKLKRMLKSALQVAEDCSFLLCIDGIDELHDTEQTTSELVAFLCDVQQPAHVKLCISSRPDVEIARECSGFLKARLADINSEDIRTFVQENIEPLSGLDRQKIVDEICLRADGIFLWATFAVQEISEGCRRVPRDTTAKLLDRLDGMGEQLGDAISFMLHRIKSSHKKSMSFYLQALNTWRKAGMENPLAVGLITAARIDGPLDDFVAACQREARDIKEFSRGIIEVATAVQHKKPGKDAYMINANHKPYGKDHIPREILRSRPEDGPWLVVAEDAHVRGMDGYCSMVINLIHRSVHDFLFHPPHAAFTKQIPALSLYEEETLVYDKIASGLQKLFWDQPFPVTRGSVRSGRRQLVAELSLRVHDVVRFKSSTRHGDEELASFIDQLRVDVWQETLRHFVHKPLLGSRPHVPGDIFSAKTLNGRLQTADDEDAYNGKFCQSPRKLELDEMHEIELNGPAKYVRCLVAFEVALWHACSVNSRLRKYLEAHIAVVAQGPVGRDTLVRYITTYVPELHTFKSRQALASSIIDAFKLWRGKSVTNWHSLSFSASILTLISRTKHRGHVSLRTYHPVTGDKILQNNYGEEEDSLELAYRLISMAVQPFHLSSTKMDRSADSTLSAMMLWDTWVAMDIQWWRTYPRPRSEAGLVLHHQTKIFSCLAYTWECLAQLPVVSTSQLDHDADGVCSEQIPLIYRVAHLSGYRHDMDDTCEIVQGPQVHFFHDVVPEVALWKIKDLIRFHAHATPLPALSEPQLDLLVKSVRRDTKLGRLQKDLMIGDLEMMRPGNAKSPEARCPCKSVREKSESYDPGL